MCIRDRRRGTDAGQRQQRAVQAGAQGPRHPDAVAAHHFLCLLYTSDAADERSSVDLGGRRIIKKKKKNAQRRRCSSDTNNTKIGEHMALQEQQTSKETG